MDNLYLLQFCCLTVTICLALLVALSRLYVKWVNKKYEQSRMFLLMAIVCLAVHYFFQMRFGLREAGDDVGMLANIIFYSPAALLITCAIINIECSFRSTKRYFIGGTVGCGIIYVGAGMWYFFNRTMHFGEMLYFLYVMFIVSIGLFMVSCLREIRHRRRVLVRETAGDLMPYVRYTYASILLIVACASLVLFSILSSGLLMIFGVVALLMLFVFVLSFVALGFNIMPMEEVIDECVKETAADVSTMGDEERDEKMVRSGEHIAHIERMLSQWVDAGGFRDPSVTLSSLSHQLHLMRSDLTFYFEQHQQRTFRVWLSDIRFQEVKRMMLQFPDYNNDAISLECGFSSRAHLYRIFKQKTGMTPGEWKVCEGMKEGGKLAVTKERDT